MFKVNPPLRTAADVAELRRALADGTIDCVATDHAPHPVEAKETEWSEAAFGMTGLETALRVVQQAMVDTGLLDWPGVADRMSVRPARIGRLTGQGALLAVGAPANLTLYDPAAPAEAVARRRVQEPQHAVRRDGTARPGGGHLPARHSHRARREAGLMPLDAATTPPCWSWRTARRCAAPASAPRARRSARWSSTPA